MEWFYMVEYNKRKIHFME